MKNTTMSTSLKISMLVLGAGSFCTAFAALIGIVSPSALFSGEIAFFLYAAAGMALIGLNDCGCRSGRKYYV